MPDAFGLGEPILPFGWVLQTEGAEVVMQLLLDRTPAENKSLLFFICESNCNIRLAGFTCSRSKVEDIYTPLSHLLPSTSSATSSARLLGTRLLS